MENTRNVAVWLAQDLEKTKKCKADRDFCAFLDAAGAHSQDGPWLIQHAEQILKEIANTERSNLFRLMLTGVYANAYLIAQKYPFCFVILSLFLVPVHLSSFILSSVLF